MPTLRKRRSATADVAVVGGDGGSANTDGSLLQVVDTNSNSNALTTKEEDRQPDIDEAEAALAAAKEVRKARAKRRRLEAKQRLPRFEVLLEQGLLPLVVDLLSDSPKSLFAMYCTSKRSHPLLTREVVVKASVYCGGNSRTIVNDLMRRIEKKSIFLPSAVRLMR